MCLHVSTCIAAVDKTRCQRRRRARQCPTTKQRVAESVRCGRQSEAAAVARHRPQSQGHVAQQHPGERGHQRTSRQTVSCFTHIYFMCLKSLANYLQNNSLNCKFSLKAKLKSLRPICFTYRRKRNVYGPLAEEIMKKATNKVRTGEHVAMIRAIHTEVRGACSNSVL